MMTADCKITARGTAYHEAGHAVVACSMGFTVNEVSIIRSEGNLGYCTAPFPLEFPPGFSIENLSDLIRSLAVCYFSGGLAEKMATGSYDAVGSDPDNHNAISILSCIAGSGEEIQVHIDKAQETAHRILQQRWQAVVVLAEELLRKEKINGDEVSELISLD